MKIRKSSEDMRVSINRLPTRSMRLSGIATIQEASVVIMVFVWGIIIEILSFIYQSFVCPSLTISCSGFKDSENLLEETPLPIRRARVQSIRHTE